MHENTPARAFHPSATPGIVVVTGIMASGKSSVAQALAERLPASVHLRGDAFRRMIVNGRVEVEPTPSAAALAQLQLRYDLATTAARAYCAAGFTVVLQDVILGDDLGEVVARLRPWPVAVVVLCPSPEAVAHREADRPKTGYGGPWTVEALDHILREETPRLGLWLDTSSLDVTATVDAISAHLADEANWAGSARAVADRAP